MDTLRLPQRLWSRLGSLESKLRGQDPLLISFVRPASSQNRSAPSIRRVAVIQGAGFLLGRDRLGISSGLASAPKGSPERLILDWISMSDSLLDELGYPPEFPEASDFLRMAKYFAPGAEILIHSSLPEAVALNQWEMAGLGDCFLRIAGAERGDFSGYLRTALKNGYDTDPILVVGTTGKAWQAAQSVGARFFPIMPEAEEECWKYLAEVFFPAFMRGETSLVERDSRDFMRMMFEDIDLAATVSS